jgi:hypothetical protein
MAVAMYVQSTYIYIYICRYVDVKRLGLFPLVASCKYFVGPPIEVPADGSVMIAA